MWATSREYGFMVDVLRCGLFYLDESRVCLCGTFLVCMWWFVARGMGNARFLAPLWPFVRFPRKHSPYVAQGTRWCRTLTSGTSFLSMGTNGGIATGNCAGMRAHSRYQ
jgi:hypothetical protein